MSRFLIVAAALGICFSSLAFAAKPKSEEDKAFYALGLAMAQQVQSYALSARELDMVTTGFEDGVKGKDPVVTLDEYGPKLAEIGNQRRQAATDKERVASAEFVTEMAKSEGAQSSESGLLYFELAAGEGAQPAATDTVEVHYHGTLRDGTVFDSSVERGQTATFALNRVIPCWTEGVQKMKVGGKARLVCPAEIAYGDRGAPPRIAPGAALVFEVELVDIK